MTVQKSKAKAKVKTKAKATSRKAKSPVPWFSIATGALGGLLGYALS